MNKNIHYKASISKIRIWAILIFSIVGLYISANILHGESKLGDRFILWIITENNIFTIKVLLWIMTILSGYVTLRFSLILPFLNKQLVVNEEGFYVPGRTKTSIPWSKIKSIYPHGPTELIVVDIYIENITRYVWISEFACLLTSKISIPDKLYNLNRYEFIKVLMAGLKKHGSMGSG